MWEMSFYKSEMFTTVLLKSLNISVLCKPQTRVSSVGNVKEARELTRHVLLWFPTHLEARFHLIELERRNQKFDAVEQLIEERLKAVTSRDERSTLCMKYARFLHKV
jgi:hypothetical protein